MSEFKVSNQVEAELSEDGKTVMVKFGYHPTRVLKIKGGEVDGKVYKGVPSRRFVPADHKSGEGPGWRVNLDLATMRRLRDVFGDELSIGDKLRAWGHEQVGTERNLKSLSDANDAKLKKVSPQLAKWLRPYQRADVRFMAETSVLNANMPRTGKTPTTIAATIEADMMWGHHLVFAPLQALRSVWETGILDAYLRHQTKIKPDKRKWTLDDYYAAFEKSGADCPTILTGDTPAERKAAINEAADMFEEGYSFWLVLNPYMARAQTVWRFGRKVYRKFEDIPKAKKEVAHDHEEAELLFPNLLNVEWDTVSVDEFHLCGLSNPNTATAKGMNLIRKETEPERAHALSGTPMGGKPIKLWGALHFIDPEKFTSRWNWARMWLEVKENDYGHSIEGLAEGMELDFYEHLKPYLVRRTKRDALPGLPPINRIPVWCDMTSQQRLQYDQMATEAEWAIEGMEEEGRLAATNILALYTRLKQFADAYCDVEKTGKETVYGLPELKVRHTRDSGKLLQLIEKLEECNVVGTSKEDDDELKCALVASQFVPMVAMLSEELEKRGVPVARMIAGKTKQNKAIEQAFQRQDPGAPRVIVMNTLMGTALTLDRAESVHILDETWNPDDQEQMESRAEPTTEELMAERSDLGVYYYRSRRSIDEYIQKVLQGKDLNNRTILDLRRLMAEQEAAERAGSAV